MPWALLAIAMVFVFFAVMMTVVSTQAARFSGRPFSPPDRARVIFASAPLLGFVGFLIVSAMRAQGLITYDSWVDTVGRYGMFACIACVFVLGIASVRKAVLERHRPSPPSASDEESSE